MKVLSQITGVIKNYRPKDRRNQARPLKQLLGVCINKWPIVSYLNDDGDNNMFLYDLK